jgi:hypothetical protein
MRVPARQAEADSVPAVPEFQIQMSPDVFRLSSFMSIRDIAVVT